MNREYENYLLSEKYQKIRNRVDELQRMLQGTINCMCATDDPAELYSMQTYAKINIDDITELNIQRLRDSGLYK